MLPIYGFERLFFNLRTRPQRVNGGLAGLDFLK